jgi:hypothetical protein
MSSYMTAGTCWVFPAIEETMMVQRLLLAGMLSGLLVALVAFGFARVFSETTIDRAITLEERSAQHDHADVETVSRETQRNAGLLTGLVSYSVALGGFLAIGLACCHGRLGTGTRSTIGMLVGLGYVSLVVVPQLKYPANPPGVGSAETIGSRTELYFAFLFLSLAAMAFSFWTGFRMRSSLDGMLSIPVAALVYAAMAIILVSAFPAVPEIPADFPKGLLFAFRMHSSILQVIIWAGLGLTFGQLASRVLNKPGSRTIANDEIPNA